MAIATKMMLMSGRSGFRGQISMESFFTIGIILAFSIPVLFLFYSVSQSGYRDTVSSQAEASVRLLADSANLVYSEGDGATKTIIVNFPLSSKEILLKNHEVVIVMKGTGARADYELGWPTFARLSLTKNRVATVNGIGKIVVRNKNGEVGISNE